MLLFKTQLTGAAGSGIPQAFIWGWNQTCIGSGLPSWKSFTECKLHFRKLVSLLQPASSVSDAVLEGLSFVCRSLTKQQSKYVLNYMVELFGTEQNPQQQNYFDTGMRAQEKNLCYIKHCCRIHPFPHRQSSSLVYSEGYQRLKVQSGTVSFHGREALTPNK